MCRRGSWFRCRMVRIDDLDGDDFWRIVRAIRARIGRQAGDLLHDVQVLTLSENRMVAVQVWRGDFGDEELRAIGIGAAIGHCQAPRLVEGERWRGLVLEAVTRIA